MVYILLQLLQIARRSLEIFCQSLGGAYELLLGSGVVRVLHQLLKPSDHHLVKHGLKSCILAVIVKICLDLLHIILLLTELPYSLVVVPISEIIKLIPHPLDGQRLNACPCTAVGLEDPQGICRLLGHLLPAVPFRLYVSDVVGCGVHGRIAGQKPRICYVQSKKLRWHLCASYSSSISSLLRPLREVNPAALRLYFSSGRFRFETYSSFCLSCMSICYARELSRCSSISSITLM